MRNVVYFFCIIDECVHFIASAVIYRNNLRTSAVSAYILVSKKMP